MILESTVAMGAAITSAWGWQHRHLRYGCGGPWRHDGRTVLPRRGRRLVIGRSRYEKHSTVWGGTGAGTSSVAAQRGCPAARHGVGPGHDRRAQPGPTPGHGGAGRRQQDGRMMGDAATHVGFADQTRLRLTQHHVIGGRMPMYHVLATQPAGSSTNVVVEFHDHDNPATNTCITIQVSARGVITPLTDYYPCP